MKPAHVFCMVLLFLFVFPNPGVCKMWETPISFKVKCKGLEEVEKQEIKIDPDKISKLIKEDGNFLKSHPGKSIPLRFAVAKESNFSPSRCGTWEYLPDGSRLWRLRIYSKEARSLNLGITRFFLPGGAKLWIYNEERSYIEGPYMDKDKTRDQLWTPVIPGHQIVIELYVPLGSPGNPDLLIGKVNHGFLDFGMNTSPSRERAPCNIDVACPEARPWWKQIRSTALYTLNGQFQCSGVLLNNTRGDFTPYFLSACHCDVSCPNAATMVIYWNYQSYKCCKCRKFGLGGNLGDNQSGAFFRARWKRKNAECEGNDFVLVELKEKPHPSYNVYYSGWDASGEMPDSQSVPAVGIHHPNRSLKAISLGLIDKHESDENYWTVKWKYGTVQDGSSGSGLWDGVSGLCIGQFHGPPIQCDSKEPCQPGDGSCKYGKLAAGWQGGGTPDTQLKYWLDPCGVFDCPGQTRQLKGTDPACDDRVPFKQVSVGNREAIWGIGADNRIRRWNGVKWEPLRCCQELEQISVGFDGTVWGVDNQAQVYRWAGSCWEQPIPGDTLKIKQVSVACIGKVWALDENNHLHQWGGNKWNQITTCPLKHVTQGADGTAWAVDENNEVCRWNGRSFPPPPPDTLKNVKQLSAVESNTVWCVLIGDYAFPFDYDERSGIPQPVEECLKIKQVSSGFGELILGLDQHGSVHQWNNEKGKWEKFN